MAPIGNGDSGGCGSALAAERQPGVGMEPPADARQLRIVAGRRQQRDAERDAVGAHRGRQRQAAQIEQVDEIGVGAEPAVELDRIGQHLRDRVDGRRGRQHQRVDAGKDALADAAQPLQPVQRRKRVGGGEPRARGGDFARHRMDRVGRRRQQIADHQISLGDPRPFIEQPRRLVERLDVDLDQRGAERRSSASARPRRPSPTPCRRRRSVGRCAEPRGAAVPESADRRRAAVCAKTDRRRRGRP